MAAATRRTSGPVLRSLSPSGRFYNTSSASSFASSTTSTFSSPSRTFVSSPHHYNRHSSPTRVTLPAGRRENVILPSSKSTPQAQKKSCMCSPTNHPGSFRCSLHKSMGLNGMTTARQQQHGQNRDVGGSSGPYQSNRLHARRSAMTNSLVRIGTVEGDLVKRALAALIRPSSHSQRRRQDFQPRKSRLSVMSMSTGSS